MDEYQARRQRADAEGIIREVHAYCEGSCPHRERCPGMACKLYRKEMAAKDVLVTLDDAPRWEMPEFGPAGVALEPQL